MDEEQWHNCEDPDAMLEAVAGLPSATDRLRLFACACVRCIWDLLQDENEESVRLAVEYAERVVEVGEDAAERAAIDRVLRLHPIVWAEPGRDLTDATMSDRAKWAALEFAVLAAELVFREQVEAQAAARFAAWAKATRIFLVKGPAHAAAHMAGNVARVTAAGLAAQVASLRRQELHDGEWVWVPDEATAEVNGYAILAALADARREQCVLLREFFSPPRPVAVHPIWLAWNGGTMPMLAESILRDQAFERMPLLGDALEDAGCADAAILSHCRSPVTHTRWCWVIALLTGSERFASRRG